MLSWAIEREDQWRLKCDGNEPGAIDYCSATYCTYPSLPPLCQRRTTLPSMPQSLFNVTATVNISCLMGRLGLNSIHFRVLTKIFTKKFTKIFTKKLSKFILKNFKNLKGMRSWYMSPFQIRVSWRFSWWFSWGFKVYWIAPLQVEKRAVRCCQFGVIWSVGLARSHARIKIPALPRRKTQREVIKFHVNHRQHRYGKP